MEDLINFSGKFFCRTEQFTVMISSPSNGLFLEEKKRSKERNEQTKTNNTKPLKYVKKINSNQNVSLSGRGRPL